MSEGPSAAAAGASLSERIRSSDGVRPVFIVGPPRTGTTLIARILAHDDDVLSLSEPFFARRVLRPGLSRAFFKYVQWRLPCRTEVPKSRCPAEFYGFMRECALRSGKGVLVVKEVFHDFGLPPPWCNVDLLDDIADSGATIVAIVRDPFDAASSTLKLVHHAIFDWPRFVLRLACPSMPRLIDDDDIVRHAARNWAQFADWVRRRRLFVVRYEDLAADPDTEVRRVCNHVGLPFDEQVLSDRRRPTAFAGLGDPDVLLRAAQPVHARSIGRGRTLPNCQRAIIHDFCDQSAAALGYPHAR